MSTSLLVTPPRVEGPPHPQSHPLKDKEEGFAQAVFDAFAATALREAGVVVAAAVKSVLRDMAEASEEDAVPRPVPVAAAVAAVTAVTAAAVHNHPHVAAEPPEPLDHRVCV